MNDDELIARMRAALDEAATTAMPTDEMPLATAAPSTRGRWKASAPPVRTSSSSCSTAYCRR